MDIVVIECPNCGGHVERKKGDYFGKCPYCGKEICFNEIKEEAEVGIVKERLEKLEQKEKAEDTHKKELKSWLTTRNWFLAIMGVCHFLGILLVALSDDKEDWRLAVGSISALIAWILLFFIPLIFGLTYPTYNILSGKNEPAGKLRSGLTLLFIGFAVCAATALLAYFAFRFLT